MNEDMSTGVPTHVFRRVGNTYITEPICRCYTAEPNTVGTIYCPASFSPKEIDILHAPHIIGNIYENPDLLAPQ